MPTQNSWRRAMPWGGAALAGVIVLLGVAVALPPSTPNVSRRPDASSTAPSMAAPTTPASASVGPSTIPTPTLGPGAFVAPSIPWPLPDLDPDLASRGPRPDLAKLATYLSGNRPIVSVAATTEAADWQLTNPNIRAVGGYTDTLSVIPGGSIGLHLAGSDRSARIDVFRLGVHDAQLMVTVAQVPVAPLIVPAPDPGTGLDEMGWPLAFRLEVPSTWRSGVYLAKVSAAHGQSYVPFIVRPAGPVPLVVMIPMMTFEAYNSWNGVSLYHWSPLQPDRPPRGYKVSFERPFNGQNGAGLLFRTAFPLIVWLEDHGYTPGFIADTDLAADPTYATKARTFVIAGHAEYWTASMRAALLAAEAHGVGVAAFGGNLIYRQVRLEPGGDGLPGRTVVSYKDATLDPLARTDPQLATIEFEKLAVPEPAREVFGADWAGITQETRPLVVAPGIEVFAPQVGLSPGQTLPALLGGELDQLADPAHGMALTETPIVNSAGKSIKPTASLWLSPGGAHVFDAGTFAWTWGLDPRYAAALPGFPTDAFAHLTAEILAWAGTPPGR